jgi:decaprenylphospho-beta-D-ribofuranose 2-oxidase
MIRMASRATPSPEAAADVMAELAEDVDLTYSWHDFLRPDMPGFVISGTFAPDHEPAEQDIVIASRLSARSRSLLPFTALNRLSGSVLNRVYQELSRRPPKYVALENALFPARKASWYYYLYGRPGFHEYQAIVPRHHFSEYVERLRYAAKKTEVSIFLAAGKYFFGPPSLMRFSGTGVCFAVNVARSRSSCRFMDEIDKLAIELGCKPNVIKDSRLSRSTVEATYPEYDRFKRVLRDVDPRHVFSSEMSVRLGLT